MLLFDFLSDRMDCFSQLFCQNDRLTFFCMQKSKTFQTQRRKELFCQEEKDFGIGMSSLLV
jgi:hypothetical protein